jgi:hypothetical protein
MAGKSQAGVVRDLEVGDLQGVASLFAKTFRKSKSPTASLTAYLQEVFVDHPWSDPDIRSKVFVEAGGHVTGFVGVFPSRLELGERPLRAAVAGSLMVDDPKGNPLAGARLLRAFMAGPQDISVTETANHTALGMWHKAGYPLDAGYSMGWLRILRPFSAAADTGGRILPPAGILRPLGRILDRGAALARLVPFRPAERAGAKVSFRDVTPEQFGAALMTLSRHFPLRPRWDENALSWFLAQAQEKRDLGYPEWRLGYGPKGQLLGAYVYFSSPGNIGWLLQAVCAPGSEGELVDDLFSHAYDMGYSGIRGSSHPWLIPALMSRRTMLYGRSFFIADARDKSLLEPIRAGRALVSGLAGETWTRLIGDRFD